MLKPPQSEFLPVESAVFGKPWYWQRNSDTMESSRSLAHVIMEMRDEMKKLEAENKMLRDDIGQPPFGMKPAALSPVSPIVHQRTGAGDNPQHINLRRNASAPALEGQYKENIVMTVRRYSIASHLHDSSRGSEGAGRGSGDGGGATPAWGRLQHEVHRNTTNIFGTPSLDEGDNSAKGRTTNRRSFQDYVTQNRAKVKTVSFLLPVDDIYTSRPVLAHRPLDQSPDELDDIAETDS